eukprot:1552658-Prorocentrum_lima.AAC.1
MVRRTLRKLHLRWWHASQKRMNAILGVAGTPQSVLKTIPQIIDICHVCRQFKLPSPSRAATR